MTKQNNIKSDIINFIMIDHQTCLYNIIHFNKVTTKIAHLIYYILNISVAIFTIVIFTIEHPTHITVCIILKEFILKLLHPFLFLV